MIDFTNASISNEFEWDEYPALKKFLNEDLYLFFHAVSTSIVVVSGSKSGGFASSVQFHTNRKLSGVS